MPTLNFELRPSSNNSAKIQVIYQFGSGMENRLRYSTGLTIINANNWNEEKQRIKNVIQEISKVDINNKLNKIEFFLSEFYIKSQNENFDLNRIILKNELDILLKKKKPKITKNDKQLVLEFLPFFRWFLDNYKINPLPTTKKPLGPGTHKTYQNTYNILNKFNNEVYRLSYKKITTDFYDDFLKYMYSKNFSTNYIGTQIKILKTIMTAAFDKDFHNNLDFKKRYFAKPSEVSQNIALTENELLRIYHLDLSKSKPIIINKTLKLTPEKLDQARDLFLIGANTGLRISDFKKLTPKSIIIEKGYKYINITTQKTGARLTIPVNPMVSTILNKRGGEPPKSMPDQHLNYAIKEVAKLAKINDPETKEITRGGKKIIKNVLKWQLISSHTARRSFCTNAYKSGMPTIDIMVISGHKTEKVFYNYIKANALEKAQKIRKHDFFNNNNLKIVNK